MTKINTTKRLTESGMMIALATILSFVKFDGPWLNGGSITLFSMLPIGYIAYKYGVKWGIVTGTAYGLVQMLLGIGGLRALSMVTFLGAVVLDYLLAFAAMGLAGAFKGRFNNKALEFTLGCVLGAVGRFFCHFLSGFLLWGSIVNDGFGAVIFSLTYNISYMGPEIVITGIGAVLAYPILKNFMSEELVNA